MQATKVGFLNYWANIAPPFSQHHTAHLALYTECVLRVPNAPQVTGQPFACHQGYQFQLSINQRQTYPGAGLLPVLHTE